MPSALVEFFEHNLWANLGLLDACAALEDTALAETTTGTYGPLGDTLVHLFAAEQRYVAGLTNEDPAEVLSEANPFPGIDALRTQAKRSGEALIKIAETFDPDTLFEGERGGQKYSMPGTIPIVQAINHATEHRSQVMTMLTQQGIEPPVLDGWTFARPRITVSS